MCEELHDQYNTVETWTPRENLQHALYLWCFVSKFVHIRCCYMHNVFT